MTLLGKLGGGALGLRASWSSSTSPEDPVSQGQVGPVPPRYAGPTSISAPRPSSQPWGLCHGLGPEECTGILEMSPRLWAGSRNKESPSPLHCSAFQPVKTQTASHRLSCNKPKFRTPATLNYASWCSVCWPLSSAAPRGQCCEQCCLCHGASSHWSNPDPPGSKSRSFPSPTGCTEGSRSEKAPAEAAPVSQARRLSAE